MNLKIVVFGLSITSSWGNGHASTYRALIRALAHRGHEVTFLERDQPWYRDHRDQLDGSYCVVHIYESLAEIGLKFSRLVTEADLVILGSYVPDGIAIGDWLTSQAPGVTAFYDIDTPVTLAGLAESKAEYINPSLIPRFDLYLSFTGGPALRVLEKLYGSPRARALYCSVDHTLHLPMPPASPSWLLGYLGTYSKDRQPNLDAMLLQPARKLPHEKFVVAGAQYPAKGIDWPTNVERIDHLPPGKHAHFYCNQQFTLNITRSDMAALGYSPSVRLFEAAACGTPIISDHWNGIEEFFEPDKEILLAKTTDDVLRILTETSDAERRRIINAARRRVKLEHSASERAAQLEAYYQEAIADRTRQARMEAVA